MSERMLTSLENRGDTDLKKGAKQQRAASLAGLLAPTVAQLTVAQLTVAQLTVAQLMLRL